MSQLETATKQYKQLHKDDHLYEEALEIPFEEDLNMLNESKHESTLHNHLDFVQDFVVNCEDVRKQLSNLEENPIQSSLQLHYVKELTQPIVRLLSDVSLFKKAPAITESEQEACESALKDLNSLNEITKTLLITKPTK